MNISSFLTVDLACDEALQLTKQKLAQAGLRALQTFDLHDARSGMQDCACPHHGTQDCDCQMVVLLVYGSSGQPVTLFLHGNDGQTWLSIADNPPQRVDSRLLVEIRNALKEPEPGTL
jgi:hypothetical protein